MSASMDNNEHIMSAHDLVFQTAQVKINNFSWLDSPKMLERVKTLKELCIGNCRLLYGSERFKFYDVVICNYKANNTYCAILTCNQDGQTKFLRLVSGQDPVVAVRQLVDGLQQDTAKLFFKYAAGSQLEGQQGYINPETGVFELSNAAFDRRIQGPLDDTAGLVRSWSNAPGGAPRGPRGNKRRAEEQLDRTQVAQQETAKNEKNDVQMETPQNLTAQAEGAILNYD